MAQQVPRYAVIRRSLQRAILSGKWPPGYRVPSEQELVVRYRCSRMTVNKAMSELAAAGLVVRRRRSGTVVAQPTSEKSVLRIQNIPQDVARQGRNYRFQLLSRSRRRATKRDVERLKIAVGEPVLALKSLHFADDIPFVAEDRLINLNVVPLAADNDFSNIAPGSWLLDKVPWHEAEHLIRAATAPAETARLLDIAPTDACLIVERRTWVDSGTVTHVELTYPGDRYQLAVRFSPSGEIAEAV